MRCACFSKIFGLIFFQFKKKCSSLNTPHSNHHKKKLLHWVYSTFDEHYFDLIKSFGTKQEFLIYVPKEIGEHNLPTDKQDTISY